MAYLVRLFLSQNKSNSPISNNGILGQKLNSRSLHLKAQLPLLLPIHLYQNCYTGSKTCLNGKIYKKNCQSCILLLSAFRQNLVHGHTLFENNFPELTIYMKRGTMLCNAPIYCPRATLNLSIQRSGGLACKKP